MINSATTLAYELLSLQLWPCNTGYVVWCAIGARACTQKASQSKVSWSGISLTLWLIMDKHRRTLILDPISPVMIFIVIRGRALKMIYFIVFISESVISSISTRPEPEMSFPIDLVVTPIEVALCDQCPQSHTGCKLEPQVQSPFLPTCATVLYFAVRPHRFLQEMGRANL